MSVKTTATAMGISANEGHLIVMFPNSSSTMTAHCQGLSESDRKAIADKIAQGQVVTLAVTIHNINTVLIPQVIMQLTSDIPSIKRETVTKRP